MIKLTEKSLEALSKEELMRVSKSPLSLIRYKSGLADFDDIHDRQIYNEVTKLQIEILAPYCDRWPTFRMSSDYCNEIKTRLYDTPKDKRNLDNLSYDELYVLGVDVADWRY